MERGRFLSCSPVLGYKIGENAPKRTWLFPTQNARTDAWCSPSLTRVLSNDPLSPERLLHISGCPRPVCPFQGCNGVQWLKSRLLTLRLKPGLISWCLSFFTCKGGRIIVSTLKSPVLSKLKSWELRTGYGTWSAFSKSWLLLLKIFTLYLVHLSTKLGSKRWVN